MDNKFVIMMCDGVLVAMDQHAADERVRLEDLRDRLLAAVASGAGLQPSFSVQGQQTSWRQQLQRRGGTASASYGRSDATAAAAGGGADGVLVDAAAASLHLSPAEPAELLASEALVSSPAGGLSHSERHLYEAYRDQIERCAHHQMCGCAYA